jgi:hypothetical protein
MRAVAVDLTILGLTRLGASAGIDICLALYF